uniref:Uncharacterized protein n=1 Tax=Halimeda micronesica TaxID=170426 RepID=A0A386AXA8_9CHLO|nr:hypothetical protein [Halimeda micronesica]
MVKNASKSSSQSLPLPRCDWLEVSLSLGSFRELESSSWFKNIKNAVQGSSETASLWSGKKWTLNGHMLFCKMENSCLNFDGRVRVTATGPLADELLELLSEFQKMFTPKMKKPGDAKAEVELPFKVYRLDIKTEIEISKGIKNWENIRKRQEEEESKKNQFARKVQLMTSKTGMTLGIGTRGKSKTYCRIYQKQNLQSSVETESVTPKQKANANSVSVETEKLTSKVIFELEFRHDKADKIGKTLLKSKNSHQSKLKANAQMNFYLKEYLKSLVPIRKITRQLLIKLSESELEASTTLRTGTKNFLIKRKKEYCETVIFPFLRKMLKNPQMKDWIIEKLNTLKK